MEVMGMQRIRTAVAANGQHLIKVPREVQQTRAQLRVEDRKDVVEDEHLLLKDWELDLPLAAEMEKVSGEIFGKERLSRQEEDEGGGSENKMDIDCLLLPKVTGIVIQCNP
jgi:hypothetical protein